MQYITLLEARRKRKPSGFSEIISLLLLLLSLLFTIRSLTDTLQPHAVGRAYTDQGRAVSRALVLPLTDGGYIADVCSPPRPSTQSVTWICIFSSPTRVIVYGRYAYYIMCVLDHYDIPSYYHHCYTYTSCACAYDQ